jgi:hypothetical protein
MKRILDKILGFDPEIEMKLICAKVFASDPEFAKIVDSYAILQTASVEARRMMKDKETKDIAVNLMAEKVMAFNDCLRDVSYRMIDSIDDDLGTVRLGYSRKLKAMIADEMKENGDTKNDD